MLGTAGQGLGLGGADSATGRGCTSPATSPVPTCPKSAWPPEHNQRENGRRPSVGSPGLRPWPRPRLPEGPGESLTPSWASVSLCAQQGAPNLKGRFPLLAQDASCAGCTGSGPTSAVRPGVTTRWRLGLAETGREGGRRAVTWAPPGRSWVESKEQVSVARAPLQEEGPCALAASPGWAQCSRTCGGGASGI